MDSNNTLIEPTAEMLDEKLYWSIVHRSLKITSNQEEQEAYLIHALQQMTPKEMIGFKLRTDQLLFDTYTSELWCAGYLMNGESCSDDGFEYFRNWIISRGKTTYDKARENADSLIQEASEEIDYYEFESFWYVASEAFEGKTGEDLYDYIDDANFDKNEAHYPALVCHWKKSEPESMKECCPKLFDRFCDR